MKDALDEQIINPGDKVRSRKVIDHLGKEYILGSEKHASTINHWMTHNGKNKHCNACVRAKAQRKQRRSKKEKEPRESIEFGENITMDAFQNHKYDLTYLERTLDPYKYAMIIHDMATKWTEGHASGRKTAGRSVIGFGKDAL